MKVPEETLKAIKNSYPVFALWIKEKGYVSKPTESDIKLWYEFAYKYNNEKALWATSEGWQKILKDYLDKWTKIIINGHDYEMTFIKPFAEYLDELQQEQVNFALKEMETETQPIIAPEPPAGADE